MYMQLQCSDLPISHEDFIVLKLVPDFGRLLGLPYSVIL